MTRRAATGHAARAVLPAAVWLAACFGHTVPLERYRLAPAQPTAPARPAALTTSPRRTISVEAYETSGIYAEPGIVYRVGTSSYGAYPNREWAVPLGTMLADATIEALRANPRFGAAPTDERSGASYDLVWRGVVQQFEEVNQGRRLSAAVRLDAAVVTSPGDSLVWQGSMGGERPVSDSTMQGVVNALSELTAETVRKLVASASGALAGDTVRLSESR
jgi:ABC-type uncharacterized transport system auxiliary subunit